MNPVERVHVVVLVNNEVIVGCSMDTIEGLVFVRYPVWIGKEKCFTIKEITINDRAIIYNYTSDDTELVTLYNAAWEGGK